MGFAVEEEEGYPGAPRHDRRACPYAQHRPAPSARRPAMPLTSRRSGLSITAADGLSLRRAEPASDEPRAMLGSMTDPYSRFEIARPDYLGDDHWACVEREADRLWR